MKRIYINEKWCLACHLCEYNCAFAGTGEQDMAYALMNVRINPNIRLEQLNEISYAVSCRHCSEPLCVKSCITGALTRADGLIKINQDKCIGCYTCIVACPYGAISPSDRGAVQKCELCTGTREGTPACVRGCPNAALVFEEKS